MNTGDRAGHLSLLATFATGTGVSLGPAFFALNGQVAEFADDRLLLAALISAYTQYKHNQQLPIGPQHCDDTRDRVQQEHD